MIKKYYQKYLSLPETARFLINLAVLGLIWIVFYKVFRYKGFIHKFYEYGVIKFTNFLTETTRIFLTIFGYEAEVEGKIIRIVGTAGIYLDKGCLARNLMGLYVGFVLAYPGTWKNKLWYIPFGLVVINILNILRLGGMAILVKCCPENVDFNHHYVFKIVTFGAILIMWYFWIFQMNKKPKQKENISEN